MIGSEMWGKHYWKRRAEVAVAEGIVVIFAWLSSDERHLKKHVSLFSSLGWNSLVCHSDLLNLFFPYRARSLADSVLGELIKEVKIRPLPIVFASFSGGPKSCMYKVLQIIAGKCEGQQHTLDEYKQVKDCICGQIYDSCPVDFTSDFGTRFVLHPSVLKIAHPPRIVSWMAKSFAFGLDSLFLKNFEVQRADYWETLYSSVNVGPFLIFCSEDDEIAPYHVVSNFAKQLRELGGDVKLLKWTNSPHVGHYKFHPEEYKISVTELLGKANILYSQRMTKHSKSISASCNPIAKSISGLHRAATLSNESRRRVAVGPTDLFFLPSSLEYHHNTKDFESIPDEQKWALFQMKKKAPDINPHGVLSKILFGAYVPKTVEGWDIKPNPSFPGTQIHRRHLHNPIKCILRSRL